MSRTNRATTPPTPAKMGPGEYAARLGITLDGLRKTSVKHGLAWQPGDKLVPVAEMDEAWDVLYASGQVKTRRPGYTGPDPVDEDGEGLSYERERARHERAKADIAEAKLAKLRRELVPVEEVEAQLASQAAAVAASWDALPAKIAVQIPGDRRATLVAIRAVVDSEREALRAQLLADIEEAEAVEAREEPDEDDEDEAPAPPPPPKRGSRASRPR